MFVFNPGNYTDAQISSVLHFEGAGNRQLTFRYDLLNKQDVKQGEISGIEAATIKYNLFAAIKRSASFTLNEYLQSNINYLSDQIQPWVVLHMPKGDTVEYSMGIFMLETPERNISGKYVKREIGAYDKTMIIESDRFTQRYFIQAGSNYVAEINKMLALSGIGKINIPAYAAIIARDREIPLGTKVKEAVNGLLGEINYNSIGVDEVGFFFSNPYVEPALRAITQTYIAGKDSVVYADFVEKLDLTSQPNVFIRVARNLEGTSEYISVVENHNPQSPTSIENRGRRIVDYEELNDISSQTALDNFTRRIALNSMSAYGYLDFTSAIMPTHGAQDTLYVDFPTVFDTPQKFSETSWEVQMSYNGQMKHSGRRVVEL